jgi:hypothetical protein
MKPRLRNYDPFANLHPQRQQPAANDAVTRITPPTAPKTKENSRSVIEARYPGMLQAISLMWGYPELNAYFDRLWIADGSQTPIDPEAMSELMLLAQIHQSIVPQRPGRSLATIYGTDYARGRRKDVWDDVPPRR